MFKVKTSTKFKAKSLHYYSRIGSPCCEQGVESCQTTRWGTPPPRRKTKTITLIPAPLRARRKRRPLWVYQKPAVLLLPTPDFGATPSAGDTGGTTGISAASATSGSNGSSTTTPASIAAPIVDQAKQQAQKVIEHTQRSAGEAIGQARQKTTSWVEMQLDSAADSLSSLAGTMRDASAQFRTTDPAHMGQVAEVATGVADAVENVSTHLRDATVDDILTETNTFARHQPALFLGGAFAVGFLLARFLKSTSASANAGGNGYAPSTDRLLPVPLDQEPRTGV